MRNLVLKTKTIGDMAENLFTKLLERHRFCIKYIMYTTLISLTKYIDFEIEKRHLFNCMVHKYVVWLTKLSN